MIRSHKIVTLLILSCLQWACSFSGSLPGHDDRKRFSGSKQFNPQTKEFENRRPRLVKEMFNRNSTYDYLIKFMFHKNSEGVPKAKLPELSPDWQDFQSSTSEAKAIWFGHSTFLLQLEGSNVLVDPVFSDSAFPFTWFMTRFQKSLASLESLPPIDLILISHDHLDHLDMESVQFFRNKKTKFIVPLGVGSHLKEWGISSENIFEKDWWEVFQYRGLEIIATPAQHFSGRSMKSNRTLWASWVLVSKQSRIYFSGDSGYDTHFKDIGKRYGPFDLAFMECGQYDSGWPDVHMFPEQTVMAFKDLNAKAMIPVHWGMFEMAYHAWDDPVRELSLLSRAQKIPLIVPKLGQVIEVKNPQPTENWWE